MQVVETPKAVGDRARGPLKVLFAVHAYGAVAQPTFMALQAWAFREGGLAVNPLVEWIAAQPGDAVPKKACLNYIFSEQKKCDPLIDWLLPNPMGDALLERARSVLVTEAILQGCDVLIWYDHDIVAKPEWVAGLARRCAQVEGIVGGLFPFRSEGCRGGGWPMRCLPGTSEDEMYSDIAPNGSDELAEVEMVSGGFVAFWVPALKAMVDKLVDSPDPNLRVVKCRKGNVKGDGFFWDVSRPVSIANRIPLLPARPKRFLNRLLSIVRGLFHKLIVGEQLPVDAWFWDACRPFSAPYRDGTTAKDGLNCHWSDDWALEYRLLECGTKAYVWRVPLLRHVGEKEFTCADAMALTATPATAEDVYMKWIHQFDGLPGKVSRA